MDSKMFSNAPKPAISPYLGNILKIVIRARRFNNLAKMQLKLVATLISSISRKTMTSFTSCRIGCNEQLGKMNVLS